MLYLVGLGLWDEKDLSLRALEILKNCDEIFLESYTSIWQGNLKNLGIDAKEVERKEVEEEIEKILDIAKEKNVAILVPGDPLIATTHSPILIEAKKKGIKIEVVHNASILTAISEIGLQLYKFGKVASISWNYSEYPYDILKQNRSIGAHTLFLLDLQPKAMTPREGLERLLEIEEKRKENLLSKQTFCIIACKLGSKDKKIYKGSIKELLNIEKIPSVIILPEKLHFSEEEFIKSL
jgi:diphthine synthase